MQKYSRRYAWQVRTGCYGFGLVELLVAMALSLVIGVAVLQVYVSQRQTYRAQDDLARLQENARFAFEQIAQDLRRVGFIGCSRKASWTNDSGNSVYNDMATASISENNGTLTLRYAGPQALAQVGGSYAWSNIPAPRLVADCSRATLFTADTVPSGYANGSQIFSLSTVTYSVSSGALQRGSDSLIASGVQSLTFEYGVAGGTGWASEYKPAGQVTNWGAVVSVNAVLTLRGDVAGDQVYRSVIALRNRLP